jgi:hypothetical protein
MFSLSSSRSGTTATLPGLRPQVNQQQLSLLDLLLLQLLINQQVVVRPMPHVGHLRQQVKEINNYMDKDMDRGTDRKEHGKVQEHRQGQGKRQRKGTRSRTRTRIRKRKMTRTRMRTRTRTRTGQGQGQGQKQGQRQGQ